MSFIHTNNMITYVSRVKTFSTMPFCLLENFYNHNQPEKVS